MPVQVTYQIPEGDQIVDKKVNFSDIDFLDDSPETKAKLEELGKKQYGAVSVKYSPRASSDKVEMAPQGPPDAPGEAEDDGFGSLSKLVLEDTPRAGTVRLGSSAEQENPDLITTENAIKVAKFGGGLGTEIATGLSGK